MLVHVECQSLDEAREAIGAGADVIMLDNFTPAALRDAARTLKAEREAKGVRENDKRTLIEVSGGLTEDNIEESVCHDVDILSTSAIHQGTGYVDFSLKIQPRHRA